MKLRELHKVESSSQDDINRSNHRAYEACVARLDRLVRFKTSPDNSDGSLLSNEEYARERSALLKEKAGLEELTRDSGKREEQCLDLSERVFEFACGIRERFAKGDFQRKKEILWMVGSNLRLIDKKLRIEAKKPFVILGSLLPHVANETGPIEPPIMPMPPRQKEAVASLCTSLLGERDSNPYTMRQRHMSYH